MGKRKVVTTEEHDMPEVQQAIPAEVMREAEDPNIKPDSGDERIADIFAEFGEEGARIVICKYTISGKPVFCGECDVDSLSEAEIQRQWGEGRYKVTAYEGKKYLASRVVHIGPPGKDKEDDEKPAPVVPSFVKDPESMTVRDMQIEMMREEMKTNREILLKMIENNSDSRSSLKELTEAMGMLKNIAAPEKESPLKLINDVLPIVKQFADMVAGGKIVTEKRDWIAAAKEIVQEIPGAMRAMQMARAANIPPGAQPFRGTPSPPGNGQPRQIPPLQEMTPEQLILVQQGLALLKKQAEKGADPELWVDIAIANLDQDYAKAVVQLLDKPMDVVLQIDPELTSIKYKKWFMQFFGGLKDALSEPDNTGGSAGDEGNPPENEAAGDAGDEVGSPDPTDIN